MEYGVPILAFLTKTGEVGSIHSVFLHSVRIIHTKCKVVNELSKFTIKIHNCASWNVDQCAQFSIHLWRILPKIKLPKIKFKVVPEGFHG